MTIKKYMNKEDVLFAKEVVKTKDPTQAWKNVFDEQDGTLASAMARGKIQHSKEIREYISDALDRQGLDLLTANSKLKKMLDAKKSIVVNNEIEEVQDNGIQMNALEKLYKLHGLLQNNVNVDARQVNVSISEPDVEQQKKLSLILDEMTTLNDKLDFTKNKVKVDVGI